MSAHGVANEIEAGRQPKGTSSMTAGTRVGNSALHEVALKMDHFCGGYGRTQILKDVCLSLTQGRVTGVFGRNGAGKTTLVNSISGMAERQAGAIEYLGDNISRWSARKRVRSGIAQVPEGRRLIAGLTVLENLELAARVANGRGWRHEVSYALDNLSVIKTWLGRKVESLSGGEQELVAIARALACHPRLLLLDEPFTGLAPNMVQRVKEAISHLQRENETTMVLVEQRVHDARAIVDESYVLTRGELTLITDGDDDDQWTELYFEDKTGSHASEANVRNVNSHDRPGEAFQDS